MLETYDGNVPETAAESTSRGLLEAAQPAAPRLTIAYSTSFALLIRGAKRRRLWKTGWRQGCSHCFAKTWPWQADCITEGGSAGGGWWERLSDL